MAEGEPKTVKYLLEPDGEKIFLGLDPVLPKVEWNVQMALGFIIGCFHKRGRKYGLTLEDVERYARADAQRDIDPLQDALPEAWQRLIDLELIKEVKE